MSDPTRNQDKIEPGDTVNVVLVYHQNANAEYFRGVVLYTPQATGDSWHIRESETGNEHRVPIYKGKLHYVQTFAEMILIKKAE